MVVRNKKADVSQLDCGAALSFMGLMGAPAELSATPSGKIRNIVHC